MKHIQGLHHVTSMAAHAQENNTFFTKTLGLRRIKKTVNFDEPSVYHLYYGDEQGTPGSVMTYFPFPNIVKGRRGAGEVAQTIFAVPEGSLGYWTERFGNYGVTGLQAETRFGHKHLGFLGPDGDGFALAEVPHDTRRPFAGNGVSADVGVRGFHGVSLRLRDDGAMAALLSFMGYRFHAREGAFSRYVLPNGNGADMVEIEVVPAAPRAREGAGSVHHIAFSVENRAAQLAVRTALVGAGVNVTPVIDRDYFWAIYFRTADGVLFEIATDEPGFTRDEPLEALGTGLKIPQHHAHLRSKIEQILPPIED